MTPEDLSAAAHSLLTFNAPLSLTRASGLIRQLAPQPGERVLDLGCGWGELLVHLVSSAPGVEGDGIDSSRLAIERGRRSAPPSVRLHVGDAGAWDEPADVVVCIGASHAFGGTPGALSAIRRLLRPGGRGLLGEGFWARLPSAAALKGLGGATEDELTELRGLLKLAEKAGLEVVSHEVAGLDEWDEFESRWCDGLWATGLPEAVAVADEHRNAYVDGYRGTLGFAYLVLRSPDSEPEPDK
jgi:SAM-dependent methyltransferase